MPDTEPKSAVLLQRLCSEVQLFDLCELASCKHKSGRFCTDPELLGRFEKIAEDEIRTPERYISGDFEGEDDTDDEFEDAFALEDSEDGEYDIVEED